MKYRLLLPLFICLVALLFLKFSETRIITGIVTDKAMQPIPSATVIIKNTSIVTATGVDGKFQLAVRDSSSTLVIKSPGYKTREIILENDVFHYTIMMEEDALPLMDVVVTTKRVEADPYKPSMGRRFIYFLFFSICQGHVFR